jgi:hypothetical protein
MIQYANFCTHEGSRWYISVIVDTLCFNCMTQSYTLLLPMQIDSKPLKTEEAVSSLAKAPVTTTELFEQFQVQYPQFCKCLN